MTTSARWHDFMDQQIAAQPTAPAVTDDTGAAWDYARLGAACDEMQALLHQNGVRPGDRVLALIENSAAALAILFATSRMGAVAIPVNARQTAAEVARIMAHAEPVVAVMTSGASRDAAAHAARLGATPAQGGFGEVHIARTHPSAPDDDRDIAVLIYTTGTTGAPKGVMMTHANLHFAGLAARGYRSLAPGHLVYGVAPMAHVIGLASMMTASMAGGATVRLEARFSVESLYTALQEGVTHLPAVPQMHALLMQHVQARGYATLDSPFLRYVSSGGAPLDPAWKRKAEAFYGLPLQNGYGMTETTAAASITHSALGDPDVSVGPPLDGVSLRIDEDVPGGGTGTGEVVIRGPNVMKGYYRNPGETAKVLSADGWMRSGDLGRIDEDGRLHILGRTKELIIHGGFNVYPPEVEAALNDHPDVVQSAVIGKLEDGDEKVLAFVQVAEGATLTAETLRAFVAERLVGYKRPSRIVMASHLPAAATGKILKHKLLETFADALG
ncbi:MAG: acyl--CoA ligase [Rhodobacteraceae bacterium]|nr:acyl--CoA ligase [Paracoccaceae bacterium]